MLHVYPTTDECFAGVLQHPREQRVRRYQDYGRAATDLPEHHHRAKCQGVMSIQLLDLDVVHYLSLIHI